MNANLYPFIFLSFTLTAQLPYIRSANTIAGTKFRDPTSMNLGDHFPLSHVLPSKPKFPTPRKRGFTSFWAPSSGSASRGPVADPSSSGNCHGFSMTVGGFSSRTPAVT